MLLHEDHSHLGSGAAFQQLIADFFPYTPPGVADFPAQLYRLCRNPLAHSVGLTGGAAPVVSFTRIFDASHPTVGWSDGELTELGARGEGNGLHPGIAINGAQWTLHCDSYYLDVINLLAASRPTLTRCVPPSSFTAGVYNWRQ